jgi:hypothetical protein
MPQIYGTSLWQAGDQRKKLVSTFLPSSSVGEQTKGKKLAGLLSLWQTEVKL